MILYFLISGFVQAQLIPCEQSVSDFLNAFDAANSVSAEVVAPTEFIFDDVTRFLGCNHTHFDVLVDGQVETYHTDVLRFDDPSPEECGLDGNCYYSFCVPVSSGHGDGDEGHGDGGEGHGDGDEGHGDADEGHGDGNEGHSDGSEGHGDGNEGHGDGDEGHGSENHGAERRFLQHEHPGTGHGDTGHHNDTMTHSGSYFLADHVLLVGHATVCCSELNVAENIAHHTCDLGSAFSAPCLDLNAVVLDAVENADSVGIVHPPEHPNGFPDGEELRKLQDGHGDSGHGDDAGHGDSGHEDDSGHGDGSHASSEYYFLGCNTTHVDLFAARHIFTYALSDLYLQSPSCHHGSHGNTSSMPFTGECVQAACLADTGGHNHGRLLQHDHEGSDDSELDTEGIDLTVNSQFYLEGYVLYSTVYDMCCHEVGLHDGASVRATSQCTTDEVFEVLVAIDNSDTDTPGDDDTDTTGESFFESTGLYVIGGGILGVVIFAAMGWFAFQRKTEESAPEEAPEAEIADERDMKV